MSKYIKIPIDQINSGPVDMETYNKSESFIHVFKCRNKECRLEFVVFSWQKEWVDKYKPYCPECGQQDAVYLRQRFVKRKICEIVGDPDLGSEGLQ